MIMSRRKLLHLAAGAAAPLAVTRSAQAQSWPARPVRIVVGYPAGITPDIVARLIAQRLSSRLGQQFVVENKPGAGTSIAAEEVVRAQPDGYTLLLAAAANTINTSLYSNLSFNFGCDIAAVANIGGVIFLMGINPSVPAKTVPEFIAYAKANPGKLNYASFGVGTAPNMAGELFKMMAGVDLVHVPYKSSYMPDLLSGQVQATFTPIPLTIAYIRSGQLRPLAVTGATPSDALPGVPTVAEFVPGYEATIWHGIGAPKGTPSEIVDQLNKAVNDLLAAPAMKAKFANVGAEPMPMTPDEFKTFTAQQIYKWGKVV
jgi:tripartite-type tricarboxylate transporter receptor subunit TctC